MSDNGGRYFLMLFFFTGMSLMFLLWRGFQEAGLSESADVAMSFTVLWFVFTLLHTRVSYMVFEKLEDAIQDWRGATNAN